MAKAKIPRFFFVAAIILLVTTIVAVAGLSFPKAFGYGLVLLAEELAEKPDEYILLTEPDPYVLQAVSNPGKEVIVGSWEDSEFDEIVSTYETNNVEIDGRYYRVNMYSAEVFSWGMLFVLSIMGWTAFGIAMIVYSWKSKTHASRNERVSVP